MEPEKACPDQTQLLALHRGELPPEELDFVCDHLTSCPACESRLADIEAGDDVLSNIRLFLGQEVEVAAEEYRGLEAKARAIPFGAPGPDAGEVRIPSQLGKYELVGVLGRGGMGIVYRGRHTMLGRDFAVKVIRPDCADHPRVVTRFLREMVALGGVDDPHVVAATDAGECDGCHFLAMELVDGLDLETLVLRLGPLPVAVAAEVIRQAAVGLQAVHERGRVHRDLKPSNLMLAATGAVKILDLGLAGLAADDAPAGGLTGSRMAMGTADYMAPEQFADSHNVDIRADVYALGCTLYKLLTGSAPFDGPGLSQPFRKERAHVEAPRPSACAARADVPAELDAVVRRMMQPDRDARFATPREVADALRPFADGADCRAVVADGLSRPQPQPAVRGLAGALAATQTYSDPTPPNGSAGPEPAGRKRRVAAVAVALLALAGTSWALLPAPVPRLPGGTEPVPAEPVPGVLFDLLQREPPRHRHVFLGQLPDHRFHYDPKRRDFWVGSLDMGFVHLGDIPAADPGYRVRLGIVQTVWVGHVGLFFGFHPAAEEDYHGFRYQALELQPDGTGGYILSRKWGFLRWREDGSLASLYRHSRASQSVTARPANGGEYTLEIAVGAGHLQDVRWNGESLLNLTRADTNARFVPGDYAGGFGGYTVQSEAVFPTARLLRLERSTN